MRITTFKITKNIVFRAKSVSKIITLNFKLQKLILIDSKVKKVRFIIYLSNNKKN